MEPESLIFSIWLFAGLLISGQFAEEVNIRPSIAAYVPVSSSIVVSIDGTGP